MVFTVQILGLPTQGSIPSVLMTCDSNRYLFNAGEGLQRLCVEHRSRLIKVTNIFLTESNLECIGGLPGVLLTIGDSTRTNVQICAPAGTLQYIHACRSFLKCPRFFVDVCEVHEDDGSPVPPVITADGVNITPVAVCGTAAPSPLPPPPPHASTLKRKRGEDDAPASPATPSPLLPRPDWFFKLSGRVNGGAPTPSLPIATLTGLDPCTSYAVVTPTTTGKFHPDKAAALGVPKGPLFGQLSKNVAVTLPDGTVVAPEQVKDGDIPGSVLLIVSCPTVAHIPFVTSHAQWNQYYTVDVCLIVHLAPQFVVCSPEYIAWTARFSPGTAHIYASSASEWSLLEWPGLSAFLPTPRIPLHASVEFTSRLHTVHPLLFPLPRSLPTAPVTVIDRPQTMIALSELYPTLTLTGQHLLADPLLEYVVHPARIKGFNDSSVLSIMTPPPPSPLVDVAAASASGGSPISPSFLNDPDAEVVFLGTSAAIPSKYRNVSGIFVRLSPTQCCLMDCGEGTWHQMTRAFGMDASGSNAYSALSSVKLIWVSHMHPDHHLGLPRLLLERLKTAPSEPVLIVGPPDLGPYLADLCVRFPALAPSFVLFNAGITWSSGCTEAAKALKASKAAGGSGAGSGDGSKPAIRGGWVGVPSTVDSAATAAAKAQLLSLLPATGIARLECTAVEHCYDSFGVKVTSDRGWSVVYSGDTRPSDSLVELGMGCDLLIHEATFDNDCGADAVSKWHSTVGEALAVACKMKAKSVLLTHFSARYPKLPPPDAMAAVGFSFDLMRAKPGDIALMPSLMPKLEGLLADAVEPAVDTV